MFDTMTKQSSEAMANILKEMGKLYNNTGIDPSQFAEAFQKMSPAQPKMTFNKNGYEIRTEVLAQAKAFTEYEHSMKFAGWEQTVKRDPESGEVVTTVAVPEVPGVDKVLETAEKFYNFVNGNK
jgi:hypothetical protein